MEAESIYVMCLGFEKTGSVCYPWCISIMLSYPPHANVLFVCSNHYILSAPFPFHAYSYIVRLKDQLGDITICLLTANYANYVN